MRFTICFLLLSMVCSCFSKRQSPPEAIVVEAPTSVSTTLPPGKPALFFMITSDDKLYYKYDSTNKDKDFIQIKSITTEKIIQVISDEERINKVTFNEKNLFIIGSGSATYLVFKKLKDAFKQKQIFKFRIVTNNDN